MTQESLTTDEVTVRNLRPNDLEAVVHLDNVLTGQRREQYFKVKLAQALSDTGVMISLAAEIKEHFVGFCLARVYYGEFGKMEQTAVLDTLGVHPAYTGHGVGRALVDQLRTNLLGLGIRMLQTEVSWDNQRLLSFFHHAGFRPAARFALDLDLEDARRRAGQASE